MSRAKVGAPIIPKLSGEMFPVVQDLKALKGTAHGEGCPWEEPPAYACLCGAFLIRNLAALANMEAA